MTYDLLVVGALDGSRLRAALAGLASVPADAVEVSPADAAERNWDADVLCTIAPIDGDVSWSLDVYLREPGPPADRAAAHLAATLGVLVLYSAQDHPPSAYWLVEPGGSRTRARVYEQDGTDSARLVIDAVEEPVALLPDVRVAALPEVIREHRMPTPITGGLPDLPREVAARLGAWEAMVRRMTAGWPPDGWYPAEYYQEDLCTRDELAEDARRMPEETAGLFGSALARIDDAFRAATREVPGEPGEQRWWRLRAPDPPVTGS
ncbi:hypothetical protein [Actinoplanes sp. GCM10030250]|uniref:hypothetical protein n=1 Tax=Actinoplanes sp. GCM10030250 TaxID=3273376 RepID=UPI003613BF1E